MLQLQVTAVIVLLLKNRGLKLKLYAGKTYHFDNYGGLHIILSNTQVKCFVQY